MSQTCKRQQSTVATSPLPRSLPQCSFRGWSYIPGCPVNLVNHRDHLYHVHIDSHDHTHRSWRSLLKHLAVHLDLGFLHRVALALGHRHIHRLALLVPNWERRHQQNILRCANYNQHDLITKCIFGTCVINCAALGLFHSPALLVKPVV